METFTAKHLNNALRHEEPPIFSVYMPTHRTHPDNANDARVFETLIQQFEPNYTARLENIIGQYRHAASQGLGADQIEAIVRDAYDGKGGTLLLEKQGEVSVIPKERMPSTTGAAAINRF